MFTKPNLALRAKLLNIKNLVKPDTTLDSLLCKEQRTTYSLDCIILLEKVNFRLLHEMDKQNSLAETPQLLGCASSALCRPR